MIFGNWERNTRQLNNIFYTRINHRDTYLFLSKYGKCIFWKYYFEAYIIYALIILKIVNTTKVLLYYFEWYFLLFFNEFSRKKTMKRRETINHQLFNKSQTTQKQIKKYFYRVYATFVHTLQSILLSPLYNPYFLSPSSRFCKAAASTREYIITRVPCNSKEREIFIVETWWPIVAFFSLFFFF